VQREFPVPASELWDVLANTDDVNRAIGMPHVLYGAVIVTSDAFYREASARVGGFLPLKWREYPFEWVRGQRYSVVRLFEAVGYVDQVADQIIDVLAALFGYRRAVHPSAQALALK
jgi:hypothetical protein